MTEEERANDPILVALRNAPKMSDEKSAEMRALMADVDPDAPCFTSGVMKALIARKREMMMACEKDTGPLRARMRTRDDETDYELHDMIFGALDAVDDLRRKRHWWRKMAEAWEEFGDALHKNDTPRLQAAGKLIAEARKALMDLGVKTPTRADRATASN